MKHLISLFYTANFLPLEEVFTTNTFQDGDDIFIQQLLAILTLLG